MWNPFKKRSCLYCNKVNTELTEIFQLKKVYIYLCNECIVLETIRKKRKILIESKNNLIKAIVNQKQLDDPAINYNFYTKTEKNAVLAVYKNALTDKQIDSTIIRNYSTYSYDMSLFMTNDFKSIIKRNNNDKYEQYNYDDTEIIIIYKNIKNDIISNVETIRNNNINYPEYNWSYIIVKTFVKPLIIKCDEKFVNSYEKIIYEKRIYDRISLRNKFAYNSDISVYYTLIEKNKIKVYLKMNKTDILLYDVGEVIYTCEYEFNPDNLEFL